MSKRLCDLLWNVFSENVDNKFSSSLVSRMLKVIQMDSVSVRGERVLVPQNMVLLNGLANGQCNALTIQLIAGWRSGMIRFNYTSFKYQYDRLSRYTAN